MISKTTVDFFKALKKNNNRDWFNAHKEEYESAKKEFELFIISLIREISRFDKGISGVKARDCIFRIYRDIRFSTNKDPYKNHMGAFITPQGKNSNGPGYYFHFEPGNSFIAGGVYQPEGPQLNAIRQEIDYNLKSFTKILKKPDFVKYFKSLNDEDRLKTVPKGYAKDNPAIELLRNKSFTVSHTISDKQLMQTSLPGYTSRVYKLMLPLHKFLKTAMD